MQTMAQFMEHKEKLKMPPMRLTSYAFVMLFTILISASMNLHAQKNWTLEECIDYALEHNINVKMQKVGADRASNLHKQSKLNLLPSASAGLSHSYNFGKSLNEDTYEYVNQQFQYGGVRAESSLNLFDGRENINTIKMRRYEMLAQLEQIEEARYDVTMNVVTYYLMVLSATEQKEIREEQLANTRDKIQQIEEQIRVGNKAKGELLEIKAQEASEKALLTRAKNELSMAYVDLAQLMNLDSVENFRVKVPEELNVTKDQPIKTTSAVYQEAVKDFPSIQKAEYLLESSKKYLKVTKGAFFPELSMSGSISSYYTELAPTSYWKQLRDINVQAGIGLSLRIPLFNKFNKFTRVSNARLDVQDNQLRLQEQKQNLYKSIQKARNEAIAAFENYQANLESVESYKEAFKYAEERYNVGLVNIVQYRIAKNDLSVARSNAASAKYNYIFKLKILEFYMGKALKI